MDNIYHKRRLVDNRIRSIAVDANNVKWFATYKGVSSYDDTTGKTYTTAADWLTTM